MLELLFAARGLYMFVFEFYKPGYIFIFDFERLEYWKMI